MVKILHILVLIACALVWMLHVPLPAECDYPISIRISLSVIEAMKTAAAIYCVFGGSFAEPFSFSDRYHPDLLSGLTVTRAEVEGVEVAMYEPCGFGDGRLGSAMIFLHGGGFNIGSINSYAAQTMELAKKTGMLVVVPEYRLAPKHPFPAAFDDSLAVTKGFLEVAESYRVNPKKVVLAGDSAGGNLATAVALALGQEESPNPLCMINLIYPALQIVNFRLPSYLQNSNGPLLDTWFVMRYLLNYIGYSDNYELAPLLLQNAHMENFHRTEILNRVHEKWVPQRFKSRRSTEQFEAVPQEGYETLRDNLKRLQDIATDLRISSLSADDATLTLLPRTHIVTCEYDPLRDDGMILHERMQRLSLNSTLTHWNFCAHGIFNSYVKSRYQKLEKAIHEMLEVVETVVESC